MGSLARNGLNIGNCSVFFRCYNFCSDIHFLNLISCIILQGYLGHIIGNMANLCKYEKSVSN